ncbi:5'-adenylylsulfate reductase-like 5 [Apostasia shenzhenica]|uniref:5'-adenylylsulfate reductase-like 5 n=1 Tax=Apostasia shenzhenica TaxID=1088818 RepID=A0A2I0ADG2_9ASPA|nr:5'-adenylylsulfate reductase-like 5 [Apostasia shenzhenica]
MSVYRWRLFFFTFFPFTFMSLLQYCGCFPAPPVCPQSDIVDVVDVLRSECPLWIHRFLPEEVKSDTLDQELIHMKDGTYFSVLFFASWCPFSQKIKSTFDALSFMFPETRHVVVEESFAMPSAFSRYGVHSFPSFLLANKTTRIRYHGPKDLDSLIHFYREITGQHPAAYFSVEQAKENNEKVLQPWEKSAREYMENEPYLTFSLLFVIIRAFAYFFPKIISQINASWMLYCRHHVIFTDVKRAWSKLISLSNKTRNFHKGAKSAGAWASSLASVSLGESSSSSSSRSVLLD